MSEIIKHVELTCLLPKAGVAGFKLLPPPSVDVTKITLTERNKQGGDLLIAFAVLHVFSFSVFWGPTPWVYLGESFPLRVRPKCIALGSATSMLRFLYLMYCALIKANRLALEFPTLLFCTSYCRRVRYSLHSIFSRMISHANNFSR